MSTKTLPSWTDYKPYAAALARLNELEAAAPSLAAAEEAARDALKDMEAEALIAEPMSGRSSVAKAVEAAAEELSNTAKAVQANTRAIELLRERLPALAEEAKAETRRELEKLYKASVKTLAKDLSTVAQSNERVKELLDALNAVSDWGGIGRCSLYWPDLLPARADRRPNRLAQWTRQVEDYCA